MKRSLQKLGLAWLLLNPLTQPSMAAQPGVVAVANDGFFLRSDSSLGVLSDLKATWSIDGVAAVAGSNLLIGADDSLYLMNLKVTPPEISLVATNVVASAAGGTHRLWLKSDGTLWALGANVFGQLGDGTTTERTNPVRVATEVVAVAAGAEHTLFLKSNGKLWATGRNNFGQLGDGSTTDRSSAVQVATDVIAVAAGDYHSLFIRSNGTLWGMGLNEYGQLGDGTSVGVRSRPVQVAIDVVAVAAGDFHSLYIESDGSLYAMGKNMYGEVGAGLFLGSGYIYTPTRVTGNVVAVAGGIIHSLFVRSDGSVWLMGRNFYSPAGGDKFSPAQLVPPGPVQVPAAPTGLSAGDGTFPAEVRLTWERSLGAARYEVWRSTSNSSGTATRIASNVTISFYDDLSATGGTTYYYWVKAANAGGPSGFSGSDTGYCTKGAGGTAPSITKQPESQTATAGATVTFTVVAGGTGSLSYQWRLNGNEIAGATSAPLVLNNVQAADAGAYTVAVSNAAGSVTSDPATLIVTPFVAAPTITDFTPASGQAGTRVRIGGAAFTGATAVLFNGRISVFTVDSPSLITATVPAGASTGPITVTTPGGTAASAGDFAVTTIAIEPPTILEQPGIGVAFVGDSESLKVTATGTPPLSYQWRFNGSDILGATNSILTLTNVQCANEGAYTVQVSNSAGLTVSSPASVNVLSLTPIDPPPPFRFANRAGGSGYDSGRGIAVDSSGNSYITGFFVSSAAFGSTSLTSRGDTDIFVDLVGEFTGTITFENTKLFGAGDADVFVVKYDAEGNLLWGRRAGGLGYDSAYGVAVDSMGNSHITGCFGKNGTFGGGCLNSVGGADAFAATYDREGTMLCANQAGGSGNDYANSVGVDPAGNVYLTGEFSRTNRFDDFSLTSAGSFDIFVASIANPRTEPPSITSQPQSQTIAPGAGVTFSVTAFGATPFSYQWHFNGKAIDGATNVDLTLSNVQMADSGRYNVEVKNSRGFVTSSEALLTVNPVGPAPVIFNLDSVSDVPGTIVTINGTNLLETTEVRFGDISAGFIVISAGRVIVAVPKGWYDGPISLRTPGGIVTTAPELYEKVSNNRPPTVSFDSPSPGQAFTGPTDILLSTTARDSDGGIKRVEYYLGGTMLYGVDTIPFPTVATKFTWSNVAVGKYTLVAAVTDNQGARNFSKPLTIIVGSAAILRPAIQIGLTGANVVLSWPTNAAGFVLETTPSLSLGPAWTPVGTRPTTLGDQYRVTEPVGSSTRFYRLRRTL